MPEPDLARASWDLERPLELRPTLGRLRGGSTPTRRLWPDRARWAGRWPSGVAALAMRVVDGALDDGVLVAVAAGPGAQEAIDGVPELVGLGDDHGALLEADPPALARLARRRAGYRMGATGDLTGALLPAVLGQRVTAGEAHGAWTRMCWAYGEPAPTHPLLDELVRPAGERDDTAVSDALLVPPSPRVLATLSSHELHRFGVERSRGDLLIGLARRSSSLDALIAHSPAEVRRRLCTLPGVGPWTASIATRVAMGDPDAVLLGDLHAPSTVAWALAGEQRADDARMLELLEPYPGNRARVQQLIKLDGISAPRRHHRYRPLPIARM